MKYKEWLHDWLEYYEKEAVKARTYQQYKSIIHKRLTPALGDYEMEDLTAMVNQEFGAAYTVAQIRGYRKNHKLPSGVDCKFKKGSISPNKGKKGVWAPGSEKGWFQKGHDPHNTVPVGTILKKTGGYLWKKIDDKPGVWTQNWRQLHILTWEEHYGPIPEGCCLIFKDGDRTNCAIENLAMVTLSENGVLNTCHLRFDNPEFTETGILIAKVKIAADKRKKKEAK